MADQYGEADRLRLRQLLPFYVNRTLTPAQHAEVDAWLAVDAGGRQELHFVQALAAAARQRVSERAPLAGYDVLAARLAASRPPPLPWWQRAWQALAAARWAPVMALGVVLVSVQLGWNMSRLASGERAAPAAYRGSAAPARVADIKLVVRRDARFADLAELLVQQRAHIVWGPSVSGELWIALDEPGAAEPVRARLAASPLVEDVMLLVQP